MAGKGSKPRPIADHQSFASNWDRIFNKNSDHTEPTKTYIIDIDGTICSNTNGEYQLAVPFVDNIAKINKLYNKGNTIIYWTARGATTGKCWHELTKDQLESWNCNYHELRMGKPAYDVWVDDKAIGASDFFN